MRHLNKNQSLAVFISLSFVTYLLFGDALTSFFKSGTKESTNIRENTPVIVEDLVAGEGVATASGDALSVHYVGTLTDGRVFDSSRDRNTPFDFTLGAGQVIRGWEEGLIGMRVGGKRTLVISPEYAYGSQGVGTIPPNATLIFEIELLDVKKSQ